MNQQVNRNFNIVIKFSFLTVILLSLISVPANAQDFLSQNNNIKALKLSTKKLKKAKKKKAKKKSCFKYFKFEVSGQTYTPNAKDSDGDFLRNSQEAKLFKTSPVKKDTDSDGLSDIYELCISHTDPRKNDSDGDGVPDSQDPDPNSPSDNNAPGQDYDPATYCDENGNTQGFEIPAGYVGNIAAGQSKYQSFCVACHPTQSGLKGEGLLFSILNQSLKSPPMNFNLPVETVADVTAFLNSANCTAKTTPPDQSDPNPDSTPTPDPSPDPSPDPTPSPPPAEPGNCDENGNTSAFGIPDGLTGNITAGSNTFQSVCSSCHVVDKGVGYTYQQLVQAVTGSPMFITNLSNQQFANLVAYLNQDNCTTSGEPTPTPSPTPPPTLEELGYQYFFSMCASCHSVNDPEPSWTAGKINHAFHDVDEMENLPYTPTPEQLAALAAYFHTLSGNDD